MSQEEFLVEDFKLKLAYLNDQYSRLWQRLGFFLTIETGLFGGLAWLAFDQKRFDSIHLPTILGIFISVIWYATAAQDRALVVRYRKRLEEAAVQIGDKMRLLSYVNDHPGAAIESFFESPLCWYCRPISITTLPAWLSLIFVAVWIFLIVFAKRIVRASG
jgi:hypothetical protein